jgi:branched-chain amino acid transport system substrate-binding protein
MKRSRFLALVAILSAVALVAAACGGDDDDDGAAAQQDCTWVVGTMGALSGDNASIGQPIFNGIEFGVDTINDQGDLACELELQGEDSQGNPDQAPALSQKLVENPDLVSVVGPYFSGETLASGDIFEQAGIAFLCPSCTNETIDDQGWTTFFRAVGDDAIQGEQAANYIAAQDASSVAIIHDNQDYSKGLADNVAKGLGDVAAKPLVINPEETDYSAVVSQVANIDPDLVFYGGYVPQFGPLAKQLRDGGVDATLLSDDGSKDDSFGDLAGKATEGVQVTCPCADPAEVEGGQEFVDGMQEAYGEAPGTFAAEGYDSVFLIAEALKDFDADSSIEEIRSGIVDFLAGVEDFPGVVKNYTFGDTGNVDVGPAGIFVYEWDADVGQFVVLGSVDELI